MGGDALLRLRQWTCSLVAPVVLPRSEATSSSRDPMETVTATEAARVSCARRLNSPRRSRVDPHARCSNSRSTFSEAVTVSEIVSSSDPTVRARSSSPPNFAPIERGGGG